MDFGPEVAGDPFLQFTGVSVWCGHEKQFTVFADDANDSAFLSQFLDHAVHRTGVFVGDVLPERHLKLAAAERVLTEILDLDEGLVLDGHFLIANVESPNDPSGRTSQLVII